MKHRHELTNPRSGEIIVAVRNNIVKYREIMSTDVFRLKLDKFLLNTCTCIHEDLLWGVVYIQPEGSKYASPDCFLE